MKFFNRHKQTTGFFSQIRPGHNDLVLANRVVKEEHSVNNMNTLVIGSVGSSKTRGFVMPNLLNTNTSYVISDVKGQLVNLYGPYYERHGYNVKVLDFINPANSVGYDPLHWISLGNIEDVSLLAEAIASNNMNGTKAQSHDSFWDNEVKLFLMVAILYILEFGESKTLNEVIRFLNLSYEKMLRVIDFGLKEKPYALTGRYINEINKFSEDMSSKTLTSIEASISAVTFPYVNPSIQKMFSNPDRLMVEDLVEEKIVLFILVDDTNNTSGGLISVFYSQLFHGLIRYADEHGGKLHDHVRFMLDDFCSGGRIANIDSIIASARSRNISIEMIIQSLSQLKAIYGTMGDNLIANSDILYMGTNDLRTIEDMARRAGVSTSKMQNLENECYIFSNSGKTRKAYKNSITSYKEYHELKVPQEKPFYQLSRYDFNEYIKEYEKQHEQKLEMIKSENEKYKIISPADEDTPTITLADSTTLRIPDEKQLLKAVEDLEKEETKYVLKPMVHDSVAEEKFELWFRHFLQSGTDKKNRTPAGYTLERHVHLRDIIDQNMIRDRKESKKISMMHVDFLLRDNCNVPVAAIEIDGPEHEKASQSIYDKYKDSIFNDIKVPLFRISAEDVYSYEKREKLFDGIVDCIVKKRPA